MSFIILEGIDKSGKSTVAEYYRQQGFEVVHFSAPDKKYSNPGYTGPSYVDEVLDILMQYDGKDIVMDRSYYGEFIWPHVYGRKPLLTQEDIEIFKEFEQRNNTQKILMVDDDVEAHWARCTENNEPLNKSQFTEARTRYSAIAHKFGFMPRTLGDFSEELTRDQGENNNPVKQEEPLQKGEASVDAIAAPTPIQNKTQPVLQKTASATGLQEKLETANAINSILSKRIIRQKGNIFDSIEKDIKVFLNERLSNIMGTADTKSANPFSTNEVQMLKTLCKQWESKLKR